MENSQPAASELIFYKYSPPKQENIFSPLVLILNFQESDWASGSIPTHDTINFDEGGEGVMYKMATRGLTTGMGAF